jgi:hypothetical protein
LCIGLLSYRAPTRSSSVNRGVDGPSRHLLEVLGQALDKWAPRLSSARQVLGPNAMVDLCELVGVLSELASWDKTVRLWDAETGALQTTLGGHQFRLRLRVLARRHARGHGGLGLNGAALGRQSALKAFILPTGPRPRGWGAGVPAAPRIPSVPRVCDLKVNDIADGSTWWSRKMRRRSLARRASSQKAPLRVHAPVSHDGDSTD